MRYANSKAIEWLLICLPLLLGSYFVLHSSWADQSKLLLHAARVGKIDSARRLIVEKGAKVNCSTQSGTTPLMLAAKRGDIELAKLLLTYKAEINARDQSGRTAIMFAELSNHVEMVRFLVANGADVSSKALDGTGPRELAPSKRPMPEVLNHK
jgi:ankyrin repeat protein